MTDQLAEAVRQALHSAPCSDRALALKAGVSQSMISRIRTGQRGCSAELAKAVADALAEWGEDCRAAEGEIRRALQRDGGSDG